MTVTTVTLDGVGSDNADTYGSNDNDNSDGASGNGNITAVGSAESILARAAGSATTSDAAEKLKRKREKAKPRVKAFRMLNQGLRHLGC